MQPDLVSLLDQLPDPILLCDEDGVVRYANRAAIALVGEDDPEWFENNPADGWMRGADGLLWPPSGQTRELELVVSTGARERQVHARVGPHPVGGAMGWLVTVRGRDPHQDKLAGMRALAAAIAQQLAAHLRTVLTNASMELMEHPTKDSAARLRAIHDAAHRAAELLRQVEAMAGSEIKLTPCTLGGLLAESDGIVTGILGPRIALDLRANEEDGPILGDPESLELLLGELARWVRAACPGRGAVRVEIRAAPPDRVHLVVAIAGVKLSPEDRANLFEPGDRLGLAMVSGVVSHHGGRLLVEGQGDPEITFYLDFPVHDERVRRRKTRGGSETVLVVDDDAELLGLVKATLDRAGYTVLTAENGIAASVVLRERHADIDLLLTDAVLPGRSGPELVSEARTLDPGIHALLMSGFSREFLGEAPEDVQMLRKPFGPTVLTERVRALLDR